MSLAARTYPSTSHTQGAGGGEGNPVARSSRVAGCPPPVADKIRETVGFMKDHLDRPLQVARLAALANVSPSHYYVLFKQHTGDSPIRFFTRLRMREARRLLEETALSVKEVAAALGFDDPFYFSRVFKSFHDVAPSEYRLLPTELRYPGGDAVAGCPVPSRSGSSNGLRWNDGRPGPTGTRRLEASGEARAMLAGQMDWDRCMEPARMRYSS